MKKISLIVALLMMAPSAGFAETAMSVPQPIMGKIKSVELGNPQTGIKSGLVVIDASGKEIQLMLSQKTAISDKTGKALTPDKLAAGEKVDIKWAGNHVASAIQIED